MIGVCDLDGFKAVNTMHGHHSGDLVLQRVAGVINRVMRRGDFVARYGGDEFVVVLPGAGMAEAGRGGRRIEAGGPAEDWESLVPGTPVGVSVGFAEVRNSGVGGAGRPQRGVRARRPGDAPRQGRGAYRPLRAGRPDRRCQRRASSVSPASRAARSASLRASSTPSSSPASTRSRLYAV